VALKEQPCLWKRLGDNRIINQCLIQLFASDRVPTKVEQLVEQIFDISGTFDVDRSKIGTQNWLKIGCEDWELDLEVNREIQHTLEYMIRILWYIHVRNKFLSLKDTADCIEWMLRLTPFTEFHPRTELLNITLNSLIAASNTKNESLAELIGLYFHDIPFELNAKLSRWKSMMATTNPTLLNYLSQAMK
jgi:hypothetical protein